jgi:hypothetical protein
MLGGGGRADFIVTYKGKLFVRSDYFGLFWNETISIQFSSDQLYTKSHFPGLQYCRNVKIRV